MKYVPAKSLIAFSALAGLIAFTPIPQMTAPLAAQASDKICMAKRTKGRQRGDKSVLVAVTKKQRASMKARGFKKVPCKGNLRNRSEYEFEMCKFAQITPSAVQVDFKKVHGATPAELCEAAK